MSNKLTYVASGTGYMRITYNECYDDPELFSSISMMLDKINKENPQHTFALLFNAWVEKSFGPSLSQFKNRLEFLETDSGGLQAITRGLKITPESKNDVYETQAKFSDYGMCFDEIPLTFSGVKSSRLDLSNRFFSKEMVVPMATLTGENIRDQIDVFDKFQSKTKPILIAQGNCYDSYMQWCDTILEVLPKDYHHKIGGVAMGAAALGTGSLQDIQRAFYYSQLPESLKSTNHLHLLGVGSLTRLLPNLIFIQNGLYGDDLHVTYDSTTHTSGIHNGRYFYKNKVLEFDRTFNRVVYGKMFEDVNKFWHLGIDSLEDFHYTLNVPSLEYQRNKGTRHKIIETYIAFALKSISNFKSTVDLLLKDKAKILSFVDKKNNIQSFNALYEVKTLKDFQYWEKHIGKYVDSKPVNSSSPNSLEDLFA